MPTPIFRGQISKGKLILDSPHQYLVQLAKLEGKRVELVVRKASTKRSTQQNAYYFGVVIEILAEHCGYDPAEMHEALKIRFLSDRQEDQNGLMHVRSTARMSTDEFAEYLNRVVRWAAEYLHVYIPGPNEADYADAVNK